MPRLASASASARPDSPEFFPSELRARSREIALDSGQAIFRTGERPESLHFVRRGEMVLVRHSRDGQPIVLQRVHEGFIAEASIESPLYHCDGVATVPTVVLAFPIAALRSALDTDARFRAAWSRHLAGEVRSLRARCERLSLHRAADRITHYLETEGVGGAVVLDRSMKSWAADLGLTHEALYRTIARMKCAGTLSVDGSRVALTASSPPRAKPKP